MSRKIEHERLRHALKCIEGRIRPKSDSLSKYRVVARSAGLELRQLGLFQAMAYWMDKGGAWSGLAADVVSWLGESEVTKLFMPPIARDDRNQLVRPVSELARLSSRQAAVLEGEAEEYIVHLKRLADAHRNEVVSKREAEKLEADQFAAFLEVLANEVKASDGDGHVDALARVLTQLGAACQKDATSGSGRGQEALQVLRQLAKHYQEPSTPAEEAVDTALGAPENSEPPADKLEASP